jgi:hypothetical protein
LRNAAIPETMAASSSIDGDPLTNDAL